MTYESTPESEDHQKMEISPKGPFPDIVTFWSGLTYIV
jgi:hypothetical protein